MPKCRYVNGISDTIELLAGGADVVRKRRTHRQERFYVHIHVLICALFLSITASYADDMSAQKTRTPLQGGVNLDETLPPLPNQYQVGNQFDESNLQSLTPDNQWFPIPSWFAGTWHSESKSVNYVQDCKSGASSTPNTVVKEVSDAVHGQQKDKTGQVWDFIEIPHTRKVGISRGTAYLRALREDVVQTDPAQVVLKFLSNQITIDDHKQQIATSYQVQQLGTYVPLEDGLVELNASLRNFDGDGAPIQMQRSTMVMKRSKPYEEVDSIHGLDLKKMFAEYLKKAGKEDLVPTQP
jgi:hypothetical protein